MAKGKALGEYSMKTTSLTINPGPGGSTLIQGNFEGTASGFGTVFGTATFVGGSSGTSDWCGVAYLDNGETNSATGKGRYESIGKHRWRTEGLLQTADGQTIVSEGEIDLATRSWKGKLFEKV